MTSQQVPESQEGLVGTGEDTAVATAGAWPWLGVWASGVADTSNGFGAGRSRARGGPVSSTVQ